jgi:uncharacterized repeat protein (TIGR03803 family)
MLRRHRFNFNLIAASIAACIVAITTALAALPARSAPVLTTLAAFDGTNGASPIGDLIADTAGNFYGTTSLGHNVFKFDPTTAALTTLATIDFGDGTAPKAGLLADAEGNLYGTASPYPPVKSGNIFELDHVTKTVTAIASFDVLNTTNGANPLGALIADAAGNLYGTTHDGGTNDLGTVFKLDPVTRTFTRLASFTNQSGAHPSGALLADAAGNLYGTTTGGIPLGPFGTVFKLDPITRTLTTLATFNTQNGVFPLGSLIADAAGNLYGVTSRGGQYDRGTVFKLNPTTGILTTLVSFKVPDGRAPVAGLIADAAGNLYGTTEYGGPIDAGTVFKLDPTTGILTTLASFNSSSGFYPLGGLIADSAGSLYGTTSVGGGVAHSGTLFKLSGAGFVVPEPSTAALTVAACGVIILCRRRFVA